MPYNLVGSVAAGIRVPSLRALPRWDWTFAAADIVDIAGIVVVDHIAVVDQIAIAHMAAAQMVTAAVVAIVAVVAVVPVENSVVAVLHTD